MADGLSELVLDCRMKGKGVTVISNGTMGRAADYKILSDLGVSLFEFPLLAENPEIHDALTQKPGSFHKVLSSIAVLKKLKPEICVVFVLTKLNIDYLLPTLILAEQLGISRFMLARFNIGGRGIENVQALLPSHAELNSAFQIADDFTQTHQMKISANVCVPLCIIDPAYYPHIPISSCSANVYKRPITVDFAGNIRICNHSPHILANIHSESIETMLSSDYVQAWQTTCPKYCLGCEKWGRCMGGCRAASEQMGGGLDEEDPIIEYLNNSVQLAAMGLERCHK